MMRSAPPKLLRYLLSLFLDPRILSEISGDLEELYADRMRSNGKWYANICYAKDVFLSVRNFKVRRQKSSSSGPRILVANNFRITFRLIRRNKIYSGLNITGLALGMAAFIFISQYVAYERSFDTFHPSYGDIYRIHYKGYDDHGVAIKDCAVSAPRVGPFLAERIPEVKAVARIFPWEGLVYSCNGKKFREDGTKIADAQFLQIFHFPMLEGNPVTALQGVNALVITESTARK
jgi:putative ABC transport system permease protein